MCSLPIKAILEDVQVTAADSRPRTVSYPSMFSERRINCGTCKLSPPGGRAAIWVRDAVKS